MFLASNMTRATNHHIRIIQFLIAMIFTTLYMFNSMIFICKDIVYTIFLI